MLSQLGERHHCKWLKGGGASCTALWPVQVRGGRARADAANQQHELVCMADAGMRSRAVA